MSEFKNYSIMLIGLGPHAKRIYINLFKKYKIIPKLIVDVDRKKKELNKYLRENGFESTNTYFIDSKKENAIELEDSVKVELKKQIDENNIKYAIISTEPKAHFAYAKFLLENNINILMDKPITAPINVCNDEVMANRIKEEYEELCEEYKKRKNKIRFKIQCQRRFHEGYIYIKNVIENIIREYNIPITYIDIYHNDRNVEYAYRIYRKGKSSI